MTDIEARHSRDNHVGWCLIFELNRVTILVDRRRDVECPNERRADDEQERLGEVPARTHPRKHEQCQTARPPME